jgi:hypothetical protein
VPELPGSPHEDPEPTPVIPRTATPDGRLTRREIARDRLQLAEAAAALRRAGMSWRQVGQALRLAPGTAVGVAESAAGTAG